MAEMNADLQSEGEPLMQHDDENGGHSVPSEASLQMSVHAPQESVKSLMDATTCASVTNETATAATTAAVTTSVPSVDFAGRDFEMRGVKLVLLKAVAAQAKLLGGNWTVGRVSNVLLGAHEILQENHRWGAQVDPAAALTFADRIALIDVLKTHHKDASSRHPSLGVCYDEVVGDQADLFVSFAYNCDFFELVGSIEAFVAANPEHAEKYFWFDMLVNNQWTASSKDFEWWASTFKEAVGRIGHTLLIGVPWSDPEPLKRAWCNFEIYCTVASDSSFDVAMGAEQQERFIQALILDAAVYYKMLGDIDVRKSTCYVAQDKANIFRVVEESVGFAALNNMVIGKMRAWALSAIEASIAQSGADTPRPQVWDKLVAKGSLLRLIGEYDSSLTVLQRCLQEFDDVDATDGHRWGHLLCELGSVYHFQGRYSLSLEHFEKSLAVRLQTLGPDHPHVGRSYNGIAIVYKSQGKYPLALEHYKKSLVIGLQALGPNHPDLGSSYNNIANVYFSQGNYSLALENFEKSMAIKTQTLGSSHPDIGSSYNNIALVYKAQGKYNLALEYYEKFLAIWLQALGPNHPDVGSCYNNIGNVYFAQGNYPLALENHEKSLVIRLQTLGRDHPNVGNSYNNIALVYKVQGNYNLALEYYEKSLAIWLQALGPNHPDVGSCYNNIANVYFAQGNYPLALENHDKSLGIRLKTLGRNHPNVNDSYNNIALVYRAQGNYPRLFFSKCFRCVWSFF